MEGANGSDGGSDAFLEHLAADVHVDLQHSANTDMWDALAYGPSTISAFPPMAMEPDCVSQEDATQDDSRNPTQASSCIRVATRVLTSMRGNSLVCLMGSHNRSSTHLPHAAVDSVLSAAQEASRAMRRLLDCRACRPKPQLQLLLAVICAEVIAAYRRIMVTYSRPHHNRGNNVLPSPPQEAEHVSLPRRAPFLIGNHHLEDDIAKMLICQVLTKKLQELEGLMGEIVQLAGQCEAVRGVQISIDSFLNVQLSAVKCELASLQRDEANAGGDIYPGARR